MIRLLFANPVIAGTAAAVVIALGAWAYFTIREGGAEAVRQEIEEQNNEAADVADAASLGFAECNDTDGVHWDFGAGECRRGPPRGGR